MNFPILRSNLKTDCCELCESAKTIANELKRDDLSNEQRLYYQQCSQLLEHHHEQNRLTKERVDNLLKTLEEDRIAIVADFSMKLLNYSPNQLSSEFHTPEQFSDLGCVVVKKEDGKIKFKKFAIMSTNLKQTSLLAISSIAKLFNFPFLNFFMSNFYVFYKFLQIFRGHSRFTKGNLKRFQVPKNASQRYLL